MIQVELISLLLSSTPYTLMNSRSREQNIWQKVIIISPDVQPFKRRLSHAWRWRRRLPLVREVLEASLRVPGELKARGAGANLGKWGMGLPSRCFCSHCLASPSLPSRLQNDLREFSNTGGHKTGHNTGGHNTQDTKLPSQSWHWVRVKTLTKCTVSRNEGCCGVKGGGQNGLIFRALWKPSQVHGVGVRG